MGDRIRLAQRALYPQPDLLQEHIAPLMPEGIIDFAKAIQIQKQQGQGFVFPARVDNGLLQGIVEQGAVGEIRDHAVQGLIAQPRRLGLAFVDLPSVHHDSRLPHFIPLG